MAERDETGLAASFVTAILHVAIFAALQVLFNNLGVTVPSLGSAGYIALLFIAIFAAAVSYYLTTGTIGGTILYSLMISVVFVMVTALVGGAMAITISDLPVAVLVMMVSGTMASILGIKLAGKAGIGRIATAITRERRVLR
jgi:hypothetical protein